MSAIGYGVIKWTNDWSLETPSILATPLDFIRLVRTNKQGGFWTIQDHDRKPLFSLSKGNNNSMVITASTADDLDSVILWDTVDTLCSTCPECLTLIEHEYHMLLDLHLNLLDITKIDERKVMKSLPMPTLLEMADELSLPLSGTFFTKHATKKDFMLTLLNNIYINRDKSTRYYIGMSGRRHLTPSGLAGVLVACLSPDRQDQLSGVIKDNPEEAIFWFELLNEDKDVFEAATKIKPDPSLWWRIRTCL